MNAGAQAHGAERDAYDGRDGRERRDGGERRGGRERRGGGERRDARDRRDERERLEFGLVLAVALAVRVAAAFAMDRHRLGGDAIDYDRLGRLLAAGHGFGHSVLTASGGPTAFRAPLYPLLLGAVYRVSGDSTLAARLAGSVLGVTAVAALMFVGRRFWGRRVGVAAGAIAAVWPPLVVASAALLSESVFVPLELGALCCAVLAVERRPAPWRQRRAWFAAAGVLCGLGLLARPNAVAFAGGLALFVLFAGRLSARRALIGSVTIVGAAAVVALPWVARDAVEFHRFVPITDDLGFNVSGVYNAQAAHDPYPTRYQWRPPVAVPQLQGLFRAPGIDEVALGAALQRQGVEWIRAHPSAVAAAAFWNSDRLVELAGIRESASEGVETGIGRRASALSAASFWVVGLLALAGLCSRGVRRVPPALWVVPVCLWLTTVPLLGSSRLRAPIDPFVVLAAGVGLVAVSSRLERRQTSGIVSRADN